MLTPIGLPADKRDRVMLLNEWAKYISNKDSLDESPTPKMICAGMGKPTYPIHPRISEYLAQYWKTHGKEAIDYGLPQGDEQSRTLMAKAMSDWYELPIDKSEILFTVGGAGSLRAIFAALKEVHADTPNFRVITPFPYYTLYSENNLHLHPIKVMSLPGYKLTAQSISDSIKSAEALAEIDSGHPRALLLCEPNNPLGTVLDLQELNAIVGVLKEHPKLNIILDEAYAELVLNGEKHVSLLTLAPELKERIIILRSGTKSLSIAGERMAITIAFNQNIMQSILGINICNSGHAPRSLQGAYAATMACFTDEYRRTMNGFYAEKVAYVSERLQSMGASMPDVAYCVKAAFYVMGDFSDVLGGKVPIDAYAALGATIITRTDEEMAYSLLFLDKIMVSPASYYGVEPHKGYIRITCSAEMDELTLLMDRMERRLQQARKNKHEHLSQIALRKLAKLEPVNPVQYELLKQQLSTDTAVPPTTALEFKQQNKVLKNFIVSIKKLLIEEQIQELVVIQRATKAYLERKAREQRKLEEEKEYFLIVDQVSPQQGIVSHFLKQLPPDQRAEINLWNEFKKNKNSPAEVRSLQASEIGSDTDSTMEQIDSELSPESNSSESDSRSQSSDFDYLSDEEKEQHSPFSAHFLINIMSNPTVNFGSFLVLFVVLTSGALVLSGMASLPALSISALAITGCAASLLGMGFFSKSINAREVEKQNEESGYLYKMSVNGQ